MMPYKIPDTEAALIRALKSKTARFGHTHTHGEDCEIWFFDPISGRVLWKDKLSSFHKKRKPLTGIKAATKQLKKVTR